MRTIKTKAVMPFFLLIFFILFIISMIPTDNNGKKIDHYLVNDCKINDVICCVESIVENIDIYDLKRFEKLDEIN